MAPNDQDGLELTIVMPCLNEAETLETCIRKAQGFLQSSGIRGEIVVGDNGSTDGSQEIARRQGAKGERRWPRRGVWRRSVLRLKRDTHLSASGRASPPEENRGTFLMKGPLCQPASIAPPS